jgi:hypothetical protein
MKAVVSASTTSTLSTVCVSSSSESHEWRVEIDVRGLLRCAGRVAGELVLICGPGAVGYWQLDLGL